jgi:hypothetical protein
MGLRMHMAATKQYLVRAVMEHGKDAVSPEFDGTKEELIKSIWEDPREVIPIGDCDNQDEAGRCKGHK